MNDPKHKIFTSTYCILEQTMFDYIDNKLSSKERHVVEKHLLDCEFCSDAMEGLELVKGRNRSNLNSKANEYFISETNKKTTVTNYRTIFAIAAGLALLIGSVFYFYEFTSDTKSDVAHLKEKSSEPTPIIMDETSADSLAPKIRLETKNNAQPFANKKTQRSVNNNTLTILTEANTHSPSVGSGATITNTNETIIADDQNKRSYNLKREDKDTFTKKGSAGASSLPSKNQEVAEEKEKEKISESTQAASPKISIKKQRLAAPVYDASKNISESENQKISNAESSSLDKISQKDSIYLFANEMPEFIGGYTGMIKFIDTNIKYPKQYKMDDVLGTIYTQFIINEEGKVIQPKIIKDLSCCDEFDAEVIRVIKMMPKWKPGKQNGKEVSVQYNLPIKLGLK